MRLVIADDHSIVLDGLQAYLGLESDIEISAVCRDGQEAIEAVKLDCPDVLVMDLNMPRCGGLEAHEHLRAHGVHLPTIIFSATMDDETILRCLRSSVDGIVLKESAASVLIDAVRSVARGERWIPPELTARAADFVARQQAGDDGTETLTAREKDIVLRVASGKPNKQVAADLGIAESTVKLHLHNAFMKLRVSNRTQLSLLVREWGWI